MSTSNEQLYSLLGRFEQGPDGGPALTAYLCPAGKWTLSYGCTKHIDGTDVQQGDTITEDQVFPYVEAAVARVKADVKRLVTRPLNAYQEAAVCSFVFNLGGRNLEKSTRLLPALNEGRWEDAAEAMGEFIRAWGKREGKWHRMAMLGLLIRRYAEACVMLGLDPTEACSAENIGLPRKLHWQPDWVDPDGVRTGGRYFDEVLPGKTEFVVIEAMARARPLPPLEAPELILTKAEPAPSVAPASAGQPEGKSPQPQPPAAPAPVQKPAVPASPSVAAGPVAAPSAPQVPQKPLPVPSSAKPVDAKPPPPPVVIAPKQIDLRNGVPYGEIPPDGKPKNMTDSARVIGLVIVGIGSIVQVLSAREIISTTIGAIFYDLSRDTAFVAMAAGGVAMLVGWATRKRGAAITARGMVNATALLK